ncbi:MAG: hypothetical protein HC896_11610, partial [Bacteroidales bacterium]|nr:hypothetical protein [Bacteroidales bacterium]
MLMAMGASTSFLFANAPKWVDPKTRDMVYPTSRYLVGFAEELDTKKEDIDEVLNNLKGYARSALIQNVKVDIKSSATLETQDFGDEVNQYFKLSSTSTSELELTGLQDETWYDKKNKVAYAICFADKRVLTDYYKTMANKDITAISNDIATAKTFIDNKDNQNALKKYIEASAKFRGIEEAHAVILALRSISVNEAQLQIDTVQGLKQTIDKGIASLTKNMHDNIDDLAFFLAFMFDVQLNSTNKIGVQLFPPTYQDTDMGSAFSRRFNSSFEQKLTEETGLNISTGTNVNKAQYYIKGTYWEEKEHIRLVFTLKDLKKGTTLASAEGKLQLSYLTGLGINYKPENFADAYSSMLQFRKDEIVGSELQLNAWTNKGESNLMYTEGEIMKIYVRANRE